ncbi:hypothetical protein QBC38DRAFT_275609 [Podospora fimiseda]|uniref:Methyltransferase n=1 Tax=Podospora fimiseda TaxID=252190 RepID=A0AAN7BWV9_9PEZI|nr:hypothetical protein QBC38DRAFT_275609 [Podospora fimiseda]
MAQPQQPDNKNAAEPTSSVPVTESFDKETTLNKDNTLPQPASTKRKLAARDSSPDLNGTSIDRSSSPRAGRPSFSTEGGGSGFSSFVDVSESRVFTPSTSVPSLVDSVRPSGLSMTQRPGAAYDGQDRDNVGNGDEDENDALEEHAATAQAEEGSIIIDSDDVGTDDGYGSDTATNASTSLAESVRDYIYENGRRYHKFREGHYNFPNDDVEQQREDMKHAMVKMLCGQQLFFAPIGNRPQHILDIGTGTGIWAIEMGDLLPSANVLGVDLSPIQPDWVPPNVRFMVDDVESPWLHPRNHFDYVHSRHTVMGIKNWPRLMRRALEHIRPGGWFEMQEVHHFPISTNNTMGPDHPISQYWTLINQGLNNLGVKHFHAVANSGLSNMMRECGFVNVTERVLQIPIGTWPKNKVLKTVGLYWRTILLDGIQAIALGPLTRGCGWSPTEVEMFLIEVRKAYKDNSPLLHMPLHIIYGQKPLDYP